MAKKDEKHEVAELVLDLGRDDLNALVAKLNELIRATK